MRNLTYWNSPSSFAPDGESRIVRVITTHGTEAIGVAAEFNITGGGVLLWRYDESDEPVQAEAHQSRSKVFRPDRYVVMAERDVNDWRRSDGPIVFEAVGKDLSYGNVMSRVEQLRKEDSFRRVQLCRLQFVKDDGEALDE